MLAKHHSSRLGTTIFIGRLVSPRLREVHRWCLLVSICNVFKVNVIIHVVKLLAVRLIKLRHKIKLPRSNFICWVTMVYTTICFRLLFLRYLKFQSSVHFVIASLRGWWCGVEPFRVVTLTRFLSLDTAVALSRHRIRLRITVLVITFLALAIRLLLVFLIVITAQTAVVRLILISLLAVRIWRSSHYFSFIFNDNFFKQIISHGEVLPFMTCWCLILALLVGAHLFLVIVHAHARTILVVARLGCLSIYCVQINFVAVLVVLESVKRSAWAFLKKELR